MGTLLEQNKISGYKKTTVNGAKAIITTGSISTDYIFVANGRCYAFMFNRNFPQELIEEIINSIVIIQVETSTLEGEDETIVSIGDSVINAGMYKVGVDIEPGEYMLFNNDDYRAYVCVSTDSNQNDIVYNENFANNYIATFNEGEYVEIKKGGDKYAMCKMQTGNS